MTIYEGRVLVGYVSMSLVCQWKLKELKCCSIEIERIEMLLL